MDQEVLQGAGNHPFFSQRTRDARLFDLDREPDPTITRRPVLVEVDIIRAQSPYHEARERYRTFGESKLWKDRAIALQLAQLGFVFIGNDSSPAKVRCAFCRAVIEFFTDSEKNYVGHDFDRFLDALLHRHALVSNSNDRDSKHYCPIAMGVKSEDQPFTREQLSYAMDPLIARDEITVSEEANLSLVAHTERLESTPSSSSSSPDDRVENNDDGISILVLSN